MAVAILLLQGQKWPYVDESLELEGDALRVDFDSVFQAVKKKTYKQHTICLWNSWDRKAMQ